MLRRYRRTVNPGECSISCLPHRHTLISEFTPAARFPGVQSDTPRQWGQERVARRGQSRNNKNNHDEDREQSRRSHGIPENYDIPDRGNRARGRVLPNSSL